jgi:predicted AAA+ superfamily ATPase
LKATSNCSLFVTGSNSSLLSGNLASRLTGRIIDFFIMPFSFKESTDYLASLGRKESLSDYLQWGGIPLRFHFQGQKEIRDEINNLYLGIVTRDILSSQRIRNERLFLQTATYVLSQSGNTVSPSSISGYLSAFDAKIQKQTVYDYLSALENAYLTTPVFRYDARGKKALESRKKYYAIDPAFISLNKNGNTKESLGFALETVICNELLSRGYEIYTGRVKNLA